MSSTNFFNLPPDTVEFEGHTYKLTPAFDNVLNMYQSIDGCTDSEIVDIMLYYLVDGKAPRDPRLLSAATEVLFGKQSGGKGKKSFDFIQDSPLIYAAFRQAYNIDLFQELGKLHWWAFSALLHALPDNTRFQQIVRIRTMDVPKATKHNAQERANIIRLKNTYRLEMTAEEREAQVQEGLRGMAQQMLAMAKR